MTNVTISLKIDAKGVSAMKQAAIVKGLDFLETEGMQAVQDVCDDMAFYLNSYEESIMAARAADPILGHVDTAMWIATFDMHMRRRDTLYGNFHIRNVQPEMYYEYTGSYQDRHGEFRSWTTSGVVANLAAVRYATGTGMVMPVNANVIIFYSYIENGIIVRNRRAYDRGGHRKYKRNVDDIIQSCAANIPDYIPRYISKHINR